MKATIKPLERFEITIGGESEEFTLESQWEGFSKLVSKRGFIIARDVPTKKESIFSFLIDQNKPIELKIITASPVYLASLRKGESE